MAASLRFPPDFLWGASTAAYQIEGGWNEGGRGESIWDSFSHRPGNTADNATGDMACDHFHRWNEDVGLMKELSLNCYRFSISWPRVLPEGRGTPNQAGLDFYSRLVDELCGRGITPIVTLYHWDLPQELHNAGGWLNRRTIDWFVEYAVLIYRTLEDRVERWTTINEPLVCANLGFNEGTHAPGVRDQSTSLQVFHHLLIAHGDAVAAGRALLPKALFSISPALLMPYPATERDEDHWAAEAVWQYANGYQLDPLFRGIYPERVFGHFRETGVRPPAIFPDDMKRIRQQIDFLGVNHYFSIFFRKGPKGAPEEVDSDLISSRSDLGWPVYPQGMTDLLTKIRDTYGDITMIVTENGLSLRDEVAPDGKIHDQRRTDYLKGFLTALHHAILKGVRVHGYCHWSLMDNFEWAQGYGPRFGLIHVDYATQKRTIKESGRAYSEIIRGGGL